MLKGYQKKYLRGQTHKMKPVVIIGRDGLTNSVIRAVEEALNSHELIKVKFNEFKGKNQKEETICSLEEKTECEMVGMIGHTAILFRQHKDPQKRKILVPERLRPSQ